MPDAPARPCLYPSCGEYAVRNGFCEEHASQPANRRGKTAERGYDAAWKRFRAWFLRRHPACVDCDHAATDVHHIKKVAEHPELRLVESNCMALCHVCHALRTQRGE